MTWLNLRKTYFNITIWGKSALSGNRCKKLCGWLATVQFKRPAVVCHDTASYQQHMSATDRHLYVQVVSLLLFTENNCIVSIVVSYFPNFHHHHHPPPPPWAWDPKLPSLSLHRWPVRVVLLAALRVSHSHRLKHTRAVLHPACDISAHTRWPTVWQLLAGQPVVQRSQHDFQTLTWLTLHCRVTCTCERTREYGRTRTHAHTHTHPHTHAHTHTHTHTHTHRMKLGWRGKDKGKNGDNWNEREKRGGSWWKG